MNNIINIINFVRGFDPEGKDYELINTTKQELGLCKKFNFPASFLIQYDALIRDDFLELFNNADNIEKGIWIEIVKPLVNACGIEWRGRQGMDWDWYVNPGFLMAYSQKERRMLCDEIMNKFKEKFGYFPEVVGSWLLDSYSMDYLNCKYDIKAFVICREQLSVDAYTLWGGYYNHGYYPSKYNMLSPAQNEENQINTPVFRMLGIDPMYEYDNMRYETLGEKFSIDFPIYTLEPMWKMGKDRRLVKWMFDTHFCEDTVNYGYLQVGQENSFKWSDIKKGWSIQAELIDEERSKGNIRLELLSETAEWFKNNFKFTPPTSIVAKEDWSENGLKSIWYSCRNYRINIFADNDILMIRDIFKFDENYKERYYEEKCIEWNGIYDNLPVVDGLRWSDEVVRCGLYFNGKLKNLEVNKKDCCQIVTADLDGRNIKIILTENEIEIMGSCELEFMKKKDIDTCIGVMENNIDFLYNRYHYKIDIYGNIRKSQNGYSITSKNDKIKFALT